MKRGLGLSLVAAVLLLVPAAASASDHWRMHSHRMRDDIRREVRQAVREAQRARFAARRDMYRAWARDRYAVRDAVRQARRDALRAARDFRRSWRD
jgi:hypothetical protein